MNHVFACCRQVVQFLLARNYHLTALELLVEAGQAGHEAEVSFSRCCCCEMTPAMRNTGAEKLAPTNACSFLSLPPFSPTKNVSLQMRLCVMHTQIVSNTRGYGLWGGCHHPAAVVESSYHDASSQVLRGVCRHLTQKAQGWQSLPRGKQPHPPLMLQKCWPLLANSSSFAHSGTHHSLWCVVSLYHVNACSS